MKCAGTTKAIGFVYIFRFLCYVASIPDYIVDRLPIVSVNMVKATSPKKRGFWDGKIPCFYFKN